MSKEIFKVGDKVYHIEYGWGVVNNNKFDNVVNFPVVVQFKEHNLITFSNDGKEIINSEQPTLSFTEYTLQGFTQERPIELPEVGELCIVKNNGGLNWHVKNFIRYEYGEFICNEGSRWELLKRIKILD